MEALERRLLLTNGPTIYTVNSTGSSLSGAGTSGTLPYVISLANANANTAGSEIVFDPVVFSSDSDQTITLGGTLTLAEAAGPEIIEGPGAGAVSVSGGHAVEVFDVANYMTATISGLTITGGSATYKGGGVLNYGNLYLGACTISGNTAPGSGGGLYNDKGAVTLSGCTINGNSGINFGGGIFNQSGTATLSQCSIDDNYAQGNGGGLTNAGTAKLTSCTISGNTIPDGTGGAGIKNFDYVNLNDCTISDNYTGHANNSYQFGGGGLGNFGTAVLFDCTISGNSAYTGGGLDNFGTASLTDCTLEDNSSQGGGGLDNFDSVTLNDCTISGNHAGSGAGLFNDTGTINLTNCTIASNTAGVRGGGLSLDTGTAVITACTITVNSAQNNIGGGLDIVNTGDVATITDTIIAANYGEYVGDYNDIYNFGNTITSSHDLIGIGGSGGITAGSNGNIVLTSLGEVGLGALLNNGGLTDTMALEPDSLAIHAGTFADYPGTTTPIATDERGEPMDSPPDIGAYQTHGAPSIIPEGATQITATTATLNALVNPDGSDTTAWFVWGTSPNLATGTTKTSPQSIGGGSSYVPVTATLAGLAAGPTYYYEVVATNEFGTTGSAILSFTTETSTSIPPVATTLAATSITSTTALLGSSVNPSGSATTAWFVYGTDPNLATGTTATGGMSVAAGSPVNVYSPLSGLSPDTIYYVRVVATSAGGTNEGAILRFTTATPTPTPTPSPTPSQTTTPPLATPQKAGKALREFNVLKAAVHRKLNKKGGHGVNSKAIETYLLQLLHDDLAINGFFVPLARRTKTKSLAAIHGQSLAAQASSPDGQLMSEGQILTSFQADASSIVTNPTNRDNALSLLASVSKLCLDIGYVLAPLLEFEVTGPQPAIDALNEKLPDIVDDLQTIEENPLFGSPSGPGFSTTAEELGLDQSVQHQSISFPPLTITGSPPSRPGPLSGNLSGTYTGTVELTTGENFTTSVVANNVNTSGGQVSATVTFAEYPDVESGVIIGTTPNVSATLSGTFDATGDANGTFNIHLPGGDVPLTWTGTVTSSGITIVLDYQGTNAGTISLPVSALP